MTFDLHTPFPIALTSEVPVGQDTQWSFTVNVGPLLDSNASNPALVYSGKVSRVELISNASYPLSNIGSAELFVSSSSVKDTLVAVANSFAGKTLSADLLPNMAQIAQTLRDSVLKFTVHLTLKSAAVATDTLQCLPTISVIANPK